MTEYKWRVDWPGVEDEAPAYYITEYDTIIAEVYDQTKAEEMVMRLNQWEDQQRFERMREEL